MRSAFPIITVIVAGIVYHLAQKTSGAASPWPLLAIAYGFALAMTLAVALTSPMPAQWPPTRGVWVAGIFLGLAAFGIEAGFFFIYRAGWPLASASVIASISVTGVLALVGFAVFGEQLTASRLIGLALATGATVLISNAP
jgi:drug/metabolite transporter (DMT)-like permease